jgi:hypothetical protein
MRGTNNTFGNAAEKNTTKAGTTVCADDYQIRGPTPGFLNNHA